MSLHDMIMQNQINAIKAYLYHKDYLKSTSRPWISGDSLPLPT